MARSCKGPRFQRFSARRYPSRSQVYVYAAPLFFVLSGEEGGASGDASDDVQVVTGDLD